MLNKYGLYVQSDGDAGDCPHRCGIVLAYFGFLEDKINATNLVINVSKVLEIRPDVYIRDPDKWNNPLDFSRDQASRLMLGIGVCGHLDMVKGYYTKVWANGCRHQNGDYLGTGEPGTLIRLFDLWFLWPLLVILDIKFLGDLVARLINPWGYDALFLPDLLLAQRRLATPFSWLATRIYTKFYFDDAKAEITSNLIDPQNNPCVEAGNALIMMLQLLRLT